MLQSVTTQRQLPFQTVLMDSWYATKEVMLDIERRGQAVLLPAQEQSTSRRQRRQAALPAVDALGWSEQELAYGKQVKVKGFPGDYQVKLFRVVVSSHRTEWIVINDLAQDYTQGAQEASAVRWKVEEFHQGVQAVDRDRVVPVPQRAYPAQPHRLCLAGLGASQEPGLSKRADDLPTQAWIAA
jgi:hypothetical protein